MATIQNYPRNENFLDQDALVPHTRKISNEKMQEIIIEAISNANQKSSRVILQLDNDVSEENIEDIHKKAGRAIK